MRTVSVYLSIVTLHVSQSPAGGFVLLCTITTITHPISIHSAPSLSEDIVVIVVQYPLKTPTRHGRTQAVKDIRLRAGSWRSWSYSLQSGSSKQSVLMQPLSGGGEVRAESVVHSGKQGSGDQSPVTSPGQRVSSGHQADLTFLTCVIAD